MDMGMEKKIVVVWIFLCRTWTNFGWTLENFFLTWKIFDGYEILVGTKIFGHGRNFCWAWDFGWTNFWTWENFC